MHLQCPNCQKPIQPETSSDIQDNVCCEFCGTSITSVDDLGETSAAEPQIFGKFKLLQKVGSGGFGSVWKAQDTDLGRIVAVKTLHSSLLQATADRERFFREARAAAQLRHPGIVMVYEVFEINGVPAIVSDFVEGVTLRELMQVRKLTHREAAEIAAQIADALDYAHTLKVVHRDVKPANVMIELAPNASLNTPFDQAQPSSSLASSNASAAVSMSTYSMQRSGPRVRLLDFGLALRDEVEVTMTVDGQVLGTPSYMSPEQASGHSHRVDRRSDVYSLGVLFYEMLVGKTPFSGSKIAIMQQVMREEPRPPRKVDPAISRDLNTICLKAMSKAPGSRYATANAFADDLRRWLNGLPIQARRIGETERFMRWCRRNPLVASLLGLLLVVFFAGFAGVWTQWRRAEAKATSEKAERTRAVIAEQNALDNARAESTARANTEHALYRSNIARAQLEWRANNVSGSEQILDTCPTAQRGWEWHFLKQLNHSEQYSIYGHNNWVLGVAYSPDGNSFASVGGGNPFWESQGVKSIQPGEVCVWDAKSGSLIKRFKGHGNVVYALAFSPDGERLATAGADRQVLIWDVASGEMIKNCIGHEGVIRSLAFSPDGERLASGSDDHSIRLWNTRDGALIRAFPGDGKPVYGIAFSPDGATLTAASTLASYEAGHVTIWNVESGEETVKLEANGGYHFGVAVSRDGQLVAAASAQGVSIWDLQTGKLQRVFAGHQGGVRCVSFSPDGQHISSGGFDATVRVWNIREGREAFVFRGHTNIAESVAFAPNGDRLVSCSSDGSIKLWDLTTHPEYADVSVAGIHGIVSDMANVESISFGEDGKSFTAIRRGVSSGTGVANTFATVGHTRIAKIRIPVVNQWLTPAEPISQDSKGILLAGVSLDDRRIAKVWEVKSGKEIARFEGHRFPLFHAAISPDREFVATAGLKREEKENKWDAEVKVWDVANKKLLFEFDEPGWRVTRLAFNSGATQRLVAIASLMRIPLPNATDEFETISKVKILDVATGREIKAIEGHGDYIAGLSFDPLGNRLAAVGANMGTVIVHDLINDREVVTTNGPRTGMDVAFTPDGTRLAVAGRLMVKLLDASNGEETLTLRSLRQSTFNSNGFNPRVRISPDGKNILAICHDSDESVSLWSIREEHPVYDTENSSFENQVADYPEPTARVIGDLDKTDSWQRRAAGKHFKEERFLKLPADQLELSFHLDRLAQLELHSPWEYLYRSSWYSAFEKSKESDADWQRAIQSEPDNANLWLDRAHVLAEQSHWIEAAAAQNRAFEIEPIDASDAWRNQALLQLQIGNLVGYRSACETLIQRYGNTRDLNSIAMNALACTASAESRISNQILLDTLPEVKGYDVDDNNRYLRIARNAILFRKGEFEQAAKLIVENENGDGGCIINALNWPLMAMTQKKLGNDAEAETWLQKTDSRIQETSSSYRPILSNTTLWHKEARLLLLLL